VMMGVLPLQFEAGQNAEKLGLTGKETFTVHIDENVKPHDLVKVTAVDEDGKTTEFNVIARFDSDVEVDYYRHGGILQMVLRNRLQAEEHTSELQPRFDLVCRLLLEKKKKIIIQVQSFHFSTWPNGYVSYHCLDLK